MVPAEREEHPVEAGGALGPAGPLTQTEKPLERWGRPAQSPGGNGGKGRATVFAFGGGKGGVGKTILTAGLGISLARSGKRVILVDADLGGSNLHMAMGMETPPQSLHDFLCRRVRSLEQILSDTPIANLQFISGASGVAGMADPKYWEKLKLIRHVKKLQADFVLIDIGAGMSFNEIDFFLAADKGIVVANPEPASIQEAYNFIKVCLFRRLMQSFKGHGDVVEILQFSQDPSHRRDTRLLGEILDEVRRVDSGLAEKMRQVIADFRPKLILNMLYEQDETIEAMALEAALLDLLGLQIENWGHVVHDPVVMEAVRNMRPETLLPEQAPFTGCVERIARKYFLTADWGIRENPTANPPGTDHGSHDNRGGDEEVICSYRCELWGNCTFQSGGFPCRIKYVSFARQSNDYAGAESIAAA